MAAASQTTLLVLTFCLILAVSVASAEDKKKGLVCLGEDVTEWPEFVLTASKDCAKELDVKEDNLKNVCLHACKWKKMGFVKDEAKPEFDVEKIKDVYAGLPKDARDGMYDDVKDCIKNVKPLSNDDNCKSHESYLECIGKAFAKNCKLEQ